MILNEFLDFVSQLIQYPSEEIHPLDLKNQVFVTGLPSFSHAGIITTDRQICSPNGGCAKNKARMVTSGLCWKLVYNQSLKRVNNLI